MHSPTEIESAVVARLRRAFPDAIAICHFGSAACGQAGPASDDDYALLKDGLLAPLALWDASSARADIAGREVDLVDLRAASTVLQHQIIAKGRRLYARDAGADLYECFILSEKTALDERRAALLGDIVREGRVDGR